jgi:hypothetical protein
MTMKWLFGLAALPFLAGVASAAQPLSEAQMDRVTAGFDVTSFADAQALGPLAFTATATVDLSEAIASVTSGEATISLWKTVGGSSSAAQAINVPRLNLPLSTPR